LRFPYNIAATAGASDFKFGAQLEFAKAHHKITSFTCKRKGEHGQRLGEFPKILGFPFNIYIIAEDRDFKFGTQLGFAKAHHKITPVGKSGHGLGLRELPKVLRFHFDIDTMAEARDIKVGRQLEFSKVHQKNHTQRKSGRGLGLR